MRVYAFLIFRTGLMEISFSADYYLRGFEICGVISSVCNAEGKTAIPYMVVHVAKSCLRVQHFGRII